MKKKLIIAMLLALVFTVTGCTKGDAIKFKKDYESINGKENKSGKKHRDVQISNNNPFIYTTAEEVVRRIENGETLYVYFGDKLCPWCRSVIEKFIEVANDNEIEKVYYVPIWDDEGNEILRDKYELTDEGELYMSKRATDAYKKLLNYFDKLLKDYTLTDTDGSKVEIGEKRIYAPNFVYIKKGKAKKLVSGISEKQKDSREELTDEILTDEENIFKEFFEN